jgi:hypothetical protein
MDSSHVVPSLTVLQLIEGTGTVLFAAFAFFWLPRSPAQCWFFTEEEKEMSRVRMLRDGTNQIGEQVSAECGLQPAQCGVCGLDSAVQWAECCVNSSVVWCGVG